MRLMNKEGSWFHR